MIANKAFAWFMVCDFKNRIIFSGIFYVDKIHYWLYETFVEYLRVKNILELLKWDFNMVCSVVEKFKKYLNSWAINNATTARCLEGTASFIALINMKLSIDIFIMSDKISSISFQKSLC